MVGGWACKRGLGALSGVMIMCNLIGILGYAHVCICLNSSNITLKTSVSSHR